MTPRLNCDNRILLIVVLITVAGASIVASSSSYFAAAKFSDPYFLLKRHMVRIFIASIFLLLAINIDYRFYRRLSPVALGISICLLFGLFLYGYASRVGSERPTCSRITPGRVRAQAKPG